MSCDSASPFLYNSTIHTRALHDLCPTRNNTPLVFDLARLDPLDSIKHRFSDRSQSLGSSGDGNIFSFVSDALRRGVSRTLMR